jgi:dethiobiotin synthetase
MTIVYVAGWGSGAGKSTFCQSLLDWMRLKGRSCAYIKPVTQCEAVTPVAEYCELHNVPCVPIGPVVFRNGVTNAVIAAEDFIASRHEHLERAVGAVRSLQADGVTVVVDGVGYPSVGSCVGCGNGDVAAALGASIILVCPDGLGDAIDTMELMISYFVHKGCTITAVVFNKVRDTVRHKRADVNPLIVKYMAEVHPSIALLGFVPLEDGVAPPSVLNFDALFERLPE